MSESKYSVDKVFRVWNDKTGECIEVGPDSDGLDLLELRLYESGDLRKVSRSLVIEPEAARLIAAALLELAPGGN